MLNKLERKYGRYAIPRLSTYIVIAYIVGYILQLVAPNVLSLLFNGVEILPVIFFSKI